jgi:hypothetical protein
MNRITLPMMMALLLSFSSHAGTIEGEVKLNYEDSGFTENAFKKEFGDIVKATTSWKVGDFFGQETVFGGVEVKNTGTNAMYFNYYVAFFDKDKKLVGAAGQGSFGDTGLKPGESTQLGSCLIHLPKDKYKDIVSYQAVIYETDKPPKKD